MCALGEHPRPHSDDVFSVVTPEYIPRSRVRSIRFYKLLLDPLLPRRRDNSRDSISGA